MQLYIFLTVFLFMVLILSTTDCGNNMGLRAKQKILFSKSIYNLFFVLLISFFWFLTAFRGSNIGNDTSTYLWYSQLIQNHGINPELAIEVGFQYFCLFLSKITPDSYFLLVASATICYVICGIYIYKHSENILFSVVFLFCIAFSPFTNILRQAIAMVIVLIAYEMIKNKRNVIAILLILFASVFHTSAIVAFLWFAHKFIPKKPIIIIVAALTVATLSASGVLNTILSTILKEYENYFSSEQAGTGWLGIFYDCLRAFVFYLFTYIAYKKSIKEHSLVVSNSVLLLMTVCLGFSVNLFGRASSYFLLISAVDIPNAFNSGNIKNRKLWMMIMGTVMLAYFIVTLIIRPEWNNLYPYEFNWS